MEVTNEQKIYWGRGNYKLYNCWKLYNEKEHKDFLKNFISAFNLLAPKYDIGLLENINTGQH